MAVLLDGRIRRERAMTTTFKATADHSIPFAIRRNCPGRTKNGRATKPGRPVERGG